MPFSTSRLRLRVGSFWIAALLLCGSLVAAEMRTYNVSAGTAETTLKAFSAQSGRSVIFAGEKVKGIPTSAVKGEFTAEEALERMLAGTLLSAIPDKATGGFAIRREESRSPNGAGAAPGRDRPADKIRVEDGAVAMGKFEVMESKLLNMDIKRSREDVQPYVIYGRDTIDKSGALTVGDFLKQRLTMNNTTVGANQSAGGTASAANAGTTINLRGLGANQTLILLDGHRMATFNVAGTPNQPDLNGVPLAAIERIEVLPTSAAGIFGGSATGGVVNIVLRRDYDGTDLKVTYENTFDTDAAIRRVDLSAGFNLEGGRTNVLLAASYSDGNLLLAQDRDFMQRGRANILANTPAIIYGAATPPLGATSNIRSLSGANLALKQQYGGANLGSPFTFIPTGYTGVASAGVAPLVANAGKYNLELANTAQVQGGRRSGMLNSPTLESVSATIRRAFSPQIDAFLELGASNNTGKFLKNSVTSPFIIQPTAPNNPFTEAIRVMTPSFGTDVIFETRLFSRRAVGGVIAKLPGKWRAGIDYTWQRTRLATFTPASTFLTAAASTEVNAGTIDVLRDTNAFPVNFSPYAQPFVTFPVRSSLRDAVARVSGPIVELPAGPIVLAATVSDRKEVLGDYLYGNNSLSPTNIALSRSQAVSSGYAEATLPIFGERNGLAGFRQLEAQVAARHDRYETNGVTGLIPLPIGNTPITRVTNKVSSTDVSVGLKYRPAQSVMTRASYSTGFVPPDVSMLVEIFPRLTAPAAALGITRDPRRGNEPVGTITYAGGGNPNLEPEQSETVSGGIVLTPESIPGLRLSVDWVRITKKDNIALSIIIPFGNAQAVLDNEANLPTGIIVRDAAAPGDNYSVGPIRHFQASALNISESEVEAFDFAADYRFETQGRGSLDFFALATLNTKNENQILPGAPPIDSLGVSGGPAGTASLKWKANAGVTWTVNRWSATWTARYFDSYWLNSAHTVVPSQGGARVASQIYHDLALAYRFDRASGARGGRLGHWLADTEIQIGVKNVFNREPPYDFTTLNIDGFYYAGLGDPRLASYYISLKRVF